MKRIVALAAVLWGIAVSVPVEAQIACSPGANTITDLQNAINAAVPGQTITVTGTCSGTLTVRNEIQRIAISGGGGANGAGGAIIAGGASTSPVLNVRGKSIVIQGLNITGGLRGIHVNRNSNAVIQNVSVSSASSDGILIDTASFATILSSTIQSNGAGANGGNGVHISEGGSAHIGFSLQEDSSASPNTITSNSLRGVLVSRSASARIAGNTISNNGADGIWVTGNSQADISSNAINGNGTNLATLGSGSGVFVNNGGNIVLGHPTVATGEDYIPGAANFLRDPNTTTVNNAEFGVKCPARSGSIDGQRGATQLTGASGNTGLDAACHVQYL